MKQSGNNCKQNKPQTQKNAIEKNVGAIKLISNNNSV